MERELSNKLVKYLKYELDDDRLKAKCGNDAKNAKWAISIFLQLFQNDITLEEKNNLILKELDTNDYKKISTLYDVIMHGGLLKLVPFSVYSKIYDPLTRQMFDMTLAQTIRKYSSEYEPHTQFNDAVYIKCCQKMLGKRGLEDYHDPINGNKGFFYRHYVGDENYFNKGFKNFIQTHQNEPAVQQLRDKYMSIFNGQIQNALDSIKGLKK